MNIEYIEEKIICLVIWNTEIENDVHAYPGRITWNNNEYCFTNEENNWRVSLDEEQLNRLRPTPVELKESLFHADYFINMTMGKLPDESTDGFIDTGLNWNDQP
jgi:hypothetical protein